MFFFGKSHIGKKRSINQDSFFTQRLCSNVTLCVVCDGMGGANGGNVASSLAIHLFTKQIEEYMVPKINRNTDALELKNEDIPALLAHAVVAANEAVHTKSLEELPLTGMGTTLVAALLIDTVLYIVNVGDSRLYLLSGKNNTIAQITHDHSYVQFLIDLGKLTPEEAASYPNRNIITRAIGIDTEIEADMFSVNLGETKFGYILLCSDGLSNFISRDDLWKKIVGNVHMEAPLSLSPEKQLEKLETKVEKLLNTAAENGSTDDITAILLQYCVEQT